MSDCALFGLLLAVAIVLACTPSVLLALVAEAQRRHRRRRERMG